MKIYYTNKKQKCVVAVPLKSGATLISLLISTGKIITGVTVC